MDTDDLREKDDTSGSDSDYESDDDAIRNRGLKESRRHVTVRQLLDSSTAREHTSAPFRVEGYEVKKVILVGNISGPGTTSTRKTDIQLDDGTGCMKARKWVGSDGQSRAADIALKELIEGTQFPYVQVVGTIDEFKGVKMLDIDDIRGILDVHQPYYHALRVIADSLSLDPLRGPPPGNVRPVSRRVNAPTQSQPQDVSLTNLEPPSQPQPSPPSPTPTPRPPSPTPELVPLRTASPVLPESSALATSSTPTVHEESKSSDSEPEELESPETLSLRELAADLAEIETNPSDIGSNSAYSNLSSPVIAPNLHVPQTPPRTGSCSNSASLPRLENRSPVAASWRIQRKTKLFSRYSERMTNAPLGNEAAGSAADAVLPDGPQPTEDSQANRRGSRDRDPRTPASFRGSSDTPALPRGSRRRASPPLDQNARRDSLTPNPLHHLSPLQREIVLYIHQASSQFLNEERVRSSVYPHIHEDEQEAWPGVNVMLIVAAAKARNRQLTLEEFDEAIENLVENDIICNPVDDQHYRCVET